MTADRASRRRLLRRLGIGATLGFAGCNSDDKDVAPTNSAVETQTEIVETMETQDELSQSVTQTETPDERETPTETGTTTGTSTETAEPTTTEQSWTVEPVESEHLIGAYYYAWYGGPTKSPFTDYSPRTPMLGNYNSRDTEVVNQHIKWALEGGINTLLIRWGGPDWWDNTTIQEYMMPAELWEDIQFMIHPVPSTLTPFEDNDGVNFDNVDVRCHLTYLFQYMEREYFSQDNYVSIRGRPPIVLFGVEKLEGDFEGAFLEAMDAIDSNPYVIADEPYVVLEPSYPTEWIDGVTIYSIYDEKDAQGVPRDQYFEQMQTNGIKWRLGAEREGLDWIPNVIPGKNDDLVRDTTPGPNIEPTQEHFRRFIENQTPYISPDIDTVFITSFNEWYEDTAVESSESLGTDLLDVAASELAQAELAPADVDERFNRIRLTFNETFTPPESTRNLSFLCYRIRLFDEGGTEVANYNIGVPSTEPIFYGGVLTAEPNDPDAEEHWRWFGGRSKEVILNTETDSTPTEAELIGYSGLPEELEMTVFFNGNQCDNLPLDRDDRHEYRVRLSE